MFGRKMRILVIICSIILCSFSLSIAQHNMLDRNIRIEMAIKKADYYTAASEEGILKKEVRQVIVVANNHEATLFVGKKIPYANWFRNYLCDNGYIGTTVDFKNVGAQLKVRPRIVQGRVIEVTVTPEISYEIGKGSRDIRLSRLSTTVMTYDGESIVLGGSTTKGQSDQQFNGYFYRDENGEAVTVTLTLRIAED